MSRLSGDPVCAAEIATPNQNVPVNAPEVAPPDHGISLGVPNLKLFQHLMTVLET